MFMEIFLQASWSIWKERNNKYFRGINPKYQSWLAIFKGDFALLQHKVQEDKKDSFLPRFNPLYLIPLTCFASLPLPHFSTTHKVDLVCKYGLYSVTIFYFN